MKAALKFCLVLFAVYNSLSVQAQKAKPSVLTTGPSKGTLVIVGGGQTDSSLKYFMEIIGGMDQPVVIIGTASLPSSNEFTVDYNKLLKLGATNVMHTV